MSSGALCWVRGVVRAARRKHGEDAVGPTRRHPAEDDPGGCSPSSSQHPRPTPGPGCPSRLLTCERGSVPGGEEEPLLIISSALLRVTASPRLSPRLTASGAAGRPRDPRETCHRVLHVRSCARVCTGSPFVYVCGGRGRGAAMTGNSS